MKRTPGEWHIEKQGDAVIVMPAGIMCGGWGISEDMANARLTAAGPTMLAALQRIVVLGRDSVKGSRIAIATAIANEAIAKFDQS